MAEVREVIRRLEDDGWFLVGTKGSHRQFKHPTKAAVLQLRASRRTNPRQRTEAGRTKGKVAMRYAVVIEKAEDNYAAYVPDLPGCVATGETVEAVEEEIRAAIRFHIEGLMEDGLEVPQPTSIAEYVEA